MEDSCTNVDVEASNVFACLRMEDSCTNVDVEASNVFAPPDKILMAVCMPLSSSVRRRVRTDHSVAFVWHASFVSSKNASSAANCAVVSSRSTSLSDNFFVLAAESVSCFCNVASNVRLLCVLGG